MEYTCIKEKEIGEISSNVKRLVKLVDGNGRKGFVETIPELSTRIENLTDNIEQLSLNVASMMKFQNEYTGAERSREKDGLTSRQRASLYISATLGVSSIITALIIKFA